MEFMASPTQLKFKRSLEIGAAKIRSKCSETGEVFPLHILPPRNIKGSPGDYASLCGTNEQDLDSPNIHTCEFIRNEPGDTLLIEFEGFILNNAIKPQTPDQTAKKEILDFMSVFIEKQGLRYHAYCIMQNLLNFRWLRRNNEIFQYKRKLRFSTINFEHEFVLPDWVEHPTLEDIEADPADALEACIQFIETRLYQNNVNRWFKISVELYTGTGLNIFPSQEINIEQKKGEKASKNNRKGRSFVKGIDKKTGRRDIPLLDERHILYALYTYDTWYKEGDSLTPININPSGFVEEKGKHYRDYKKGNCIYNFQEELPSLTKALTSITDSSAISGDSHFTAGNYMKGGVFGEKSE